MGAEQTAEQGSHGTAGPKGRGLPAGGCLTHSGSREGTLHGGQRSLPHARALRVEADAHAGPLRRLPRRSSLKVEAARLPLRAAAGTAGTTGRVFPGPSGSDWERAGDGRSGRARQPRRCCAPRPAPLGGSSAAAGGGEGPAFGEQLPLEPARSLRGGGRNSAETGGAERFRFPRTRRGCRRGPASPRSRRPCAPARGCPAAWGSARWGSGQAARGGSPGAAGRGEKLGARRAARAKAT